MSVGLKGDYLRVSKPLTSDGINPIVKDDRIQYKETFLPIRAKDMLEKRNAKLPDARKLKIEVVKNTYEAPKNKGGRPPKNQSNDQQ